MSGQSLALGMGKFEFFLKILIVIKMLIQSCDVLLQKMQRKSHCKMLISFSKKKLQVVFASSF